MKIIYKVCLFLFLILYSSLTTAQGYSIDSLQKALQKAKEDTDKVKTMYILGFEFGAKKDFTPAFYYAKDALQLSEKINYLYGESGANKAIGFIYSIKGMPDSTIKYFLVSLKIAERTNTIEDMARISFLIASIYGSQIGDYAESLPYYYNALKWYEKSGDSLQIANCLYQISAMNYWLENYDESFKNCRACLEISKKIKFQTGVIESYIYCAKIYTVRGNYAEALKNDSIALIIADSVQYHEGIGDVHTGLGIIFQKLSHIAKTSGNEQLSGDYLREAEKNYLTALEKFREAHDIGAVCDTYSQLGSVYTDLHQFSEAHKYVEMAVKTGVNIAVADNLKSAYKSFEELDSAEGNYKLAYEHYKLYTLYKDSAINNATTKKILFAQTQYTFDKKETLAKTEQDKKDAETKRIKNRQYFVIAGLGMVVLAVVIIALIQFRNNKQKKLTNLLLESQKQKVESTLDDLKSTQSQLIQSEKMASLGELTAGIAHEIQNPLNFVNNFSEVNAELIDEAGQEINKGNIDEVKVILSDIKENSEKINHHGKRAADIVKGMLQHSRTSTGVKEPTDINALADEFFRLSYQGLRAKDKSFNATMKTDFDETIGKINIIPQDIGRVLLNLLNNAFYAVNEQKSKDPISYEPTVSVTTKKSDNHVIITVSDNGNGIPQKIIDKIFQPFFTTKPTGLGTGLGLSLSYDIIKAHSGEIKVESKEGEGSVFVIKLLIT